MKRSSHVIRLRGRWRFPLSVAAGVTRAGHGRAAAQLSKQTCVSYVGGAPAWRGRVAAEVWTGQVCIGHAGGTLAEHRRMPAPCHGRGVRWRTAESLLSGLLLTHWRYHMQGHHNIALAMYMLLAAYFKTAVSPTLEPTGDVIFMV